jgi:hypothetical protein
MVGTLFERSHIPLRKRLLAIHLLTSSKKGMSAISAAETNSFAVVITTKSGA